MLIPGSQLASFVGPRPDLVIVGAGAAGITLACELDGSGLTVWLLEAGGDKQDGRLTDTYAGVANAPHADPTQYRRIGLGGTTSIWGGRCVPYDPIDFEPRAHIPGSGWPISHDEVAQHYPKALAYCDAGAYAFTAKASITGAPETVAGFDGGGVVQTDIIERYSLPTNFGTRYRERLIASKNVTVVTDARCVALNSTADESAIASITVVDSSGARRDIEAARFVLATGGIEVARLLLASGIGNKSDHVGRWYQCHFENTFGRLIPNGAKTQFDFERTVEGVYCRRKLLFTAEAQRQHRLLNTAFRLHFPDYSDARHGSSVMSMIFLAKSILIKEYQTILQHNTNVTFAGTRWQHIRNVLFGVPSLVKFVFDMVFKRFLAERKLPYTLVANADGSYPLEFNCEQTPNADSRITLIPDSRDAHGVPRVKVEWQLPDADIDAACRAFRLLRETVSAGSAARLEFDDAALRQRMANCVPLGGHHIGTARMAATAADGVVDGHCAVFERPNLFIASSAVFPTSSHANPTLTIVAMAVRLAAHLKQR